VTVAELTHCPHCSSRLLLDFAVHWCLFCGTPREPPDTERQEELRAEVVRDQHLKGAPGGDQSAAYRFSASGAC
jgi:hypothetical protein